MREKTVPFTARPFAAGASTARSVITTLTARMLRLADASRRRNLAAANHRVATTVAGTRQRDHHSSRASPMENSAGGPARGTKASARRGEYDRRLTLRPRPGTWTG